MAKNTYAVFRRSLAGGHYHCVFTAEDKGYGIDWATRYAREAKPGVVFAVYELPAGTGPRRNTRREPEGKLLYEVSSGMAKIQALMKHRLAKGR